MVVILYQFVFHCHLIKIYQYNISAPPAKTDPDFKAFLAERNPRQQHSSTLESYLIKPIQRVLKYPLLLRELHSLTHPDSEEHYHLDGKPVSLFGGGEAWGVIHIHDIRCRPMEL